MAFVGGEDDIRLGDFGRVKPCHVRKPQEHAGLRLLTAGGKSNRPRWNSYTWENVLRFGILLSKKIRGCDRDFRFRQCGRQPVANVGNDTERAHIRRFFKFRKRRMQTDDAGPGTRAEWEKKPLRHCQPGAGGCVGTVVFHGANHIIAIAASVQVDADHCPVKEAASAVGQILSASDQAPTTSTALRHFFSSAERLLTCYRSHVSNKFTCKPGIC